MRLVGNVEIPQQAFMNQFLRRQESHDGKTILVLHGINQLHFFYKKLRFLLPQEYMRLVGNVEIPQQAFMNQFLRRQESHN